MKTTLKVIGWTLLSLVAVVLIAIGIAVYVVFTPKRLTPLVDKVAQHFITCPYEIDKIDLCLIRNFPNFGLELEGVYLINPTKGAPSDTVIAIPRLSLGVDVKKAIDGDILIQRFQLNDVEANIFIAADGSTNFDVLQLPTSADSVEEDTIPAAWQLRSVALASAIQMNTRSIRFVDERDSLSANFDQMAIVLDHIQYDSIYAGLIQVAMDKLGFTFKDETYAKQLDLGIELPIYAKGLQDIHLQPARISVNQFTIGLEGTAGLLENGGFQGDIKLQTNEWNIQELLALLPASIAALVPTELNVDGQLQLNAHAAGVFDSTHWPLVDARVRLTKVAGSYDYPNIPYRLRDTKATLDAHLDMNHQDLTTVTIQNLYAKTNDNTIQLRGKASQIFKRGGNFELANPLVEVHATANLNLAEANRYLNTDSTQMEVHGRTLAKIDGKTRLNDITGQHWENINATAKLDITDVNFHMDSLQAFIDKGSLHASLVAPTDGKTHIPTIAVGFDLNDVVANMDTIHAHLVQPIGDATIRASRQDASSQSIGLQFTVTECQTNMGPEFIVETGKMTLRAASRFNKNEEQFLLRWNPMLSFDLQNAKAKLPNIEPIAAIPQMKFAYSNKRFTIDTSRIVLGHSDFCLSGQVEHISEWVRHEQNLTGELNFTSSYTDVDELLSVLPNGDTDTIRQTPDTIHQTPDTTVSDPFIVPKDVDLVLNTRLAATHALGQDLRNLGGKVTIRNGEVILDQMGFVCEAAKLQLSAMYRTPKRDHIYVGFDYHMVDVDIEQLINMIPQLDTLMPMLQSFRGMAQFHIAAETYVNDRYQLKTSTLRGACDIEGKNLVLLDSETFGKVAKILLFNRKTENLIDSINAQVTLYKDEITVYPFCVTMDNYMIAAGGNHYLDMNFNYHASLLSPFYIGVDIIGNTDDLKIKAAKCRFAKDFRPIIHKDTQTKSNELKKLIADALKQNVKIQ